MTQGNCRTLKFRVERAHGGSPDVDVAAWTTNAGANHPPSGDSVQNRAFRSDSVFNKTMIPNGTLC